jgi:hypothetical protein
MTEEERAVLFREQLAKRRQARCARFVALAGDREAREALDLAWQPYLLASLEAQAGGGYPDAEEEVPCRVPDSQRYISRVPGELLL